MRHTAVILLGLAVACSEPQPQDFQEKPGGTQTAGTPGPTGGTTFTGTTSTTSPTRPTTTVDCSGFQTPKSFAELDLPTSEDFTFDQDGWMYGIDQQTQGLVRSNRYGDIELLHPNVSSWGRGRPDERSPAKLSIGVFVAFVSSRARGLVRGTSGLLYLPTY